MDKIQIFQKRLRKIGIELEFAGNVPFIYLYKINGAHVKETYLANHGFTVAWYPTKVNGEIKFTDLQEIFKLIKKNYK